MVALLVNVVYSNGPPVRGNTIAFTMRSHYGAIVRVPLENKNQENKL